MKAMQWMATGMTVAGLATMAVAGPLPQAHAWAKKVGPEAAAAALAQIGVTNKQEQAAIMADWDADAVIHLVLEKKAYKAIQGPLGVDKMSPAGRAKIKAAVLSETPPPRQTLDIAYQFPVEERGEFEEAAIASLPVRYSGQPELGRLVVKYRLMAGIPHFSPKVDESDLIRVLLAVEGLDMNSAQQCKEALRQRAVDMARVKLRADGESFVMKNGVNPLVVRTQPVVDALNAPMCEGLEAAFRALGSEVQDIDRSALARRATQWQDRLMAGELNAAEAGWFAGKLAVALGPDGFNRFVDAYNNGTGGAQ